MLELGLEMSQLRWLTLILLLVLSTKAINGQGGGADDASSADQGGDNQSGPPPADPNLVAPTNRQGYGKNIKTQLSKADTAPMKSNAIQTDIGEQSIQALLQFGVLVGVALLVGVLFMLNIGLDLLLDAVTEKCVDWFGKKKAVDPETPAALVGTFKRYK